MATPQVFLSFDIQHDEAERAAFVSQIENSTTGFKVQYWSTRDHSDLVESDKSVRGKIGGCDLLIVLVSPGTASAANVEREIAMAKQRNVPFFGVLVGGADESAANPPGLPANRRAPMDWKLVDSAIKQLMTEGKHHVFR